MAVSPNTKVIRTSEGSNAAIKVSGNSIVLGGDNRHVIAVNQQGTTIRGPISLAVDSQNIRVGALFVGMNDFLKCIPSTQWFPVPQQLPIPPVAGLVNIAKDVAFFASLLV